MLTFCLRLQNPLRFYNQDMRAALPTLIVLACLASPLAQAQTQAPAGQPEKLEAPAAKAGGRPEQRVENIRHEDAGSRIDEVRVGGETKSITVQPKGGMPAYEVLPDNGTRTPPTLNREGSASGSRVWTIKGF
jgi:hypothetical protein